MWEVTAIFIYPENLRAKPMLWLWELRDIGIIGVSFLLSVLALSQGIGMIPLVITVLYAFLSIRLDGSSILDFLRRAVCFLFMEGMSDEKAYERLGPDGIIALIFWGDYSYGTYDTRFMIERYVDLDERWLFDLAKDPEGRKPTVTWQTYNRGGVLYGSYDEMFISLLPLKVENPELKRVLWDYFRIRSQKKKVAKSITVYKDAAERFGDE